MGTTGMGQGVLSFLQRTHRLEGGLIWLQDEGEHFQKAAEFLFEVIFFVFVVFPRVFRPLQLHFATSVFYIILKRSIFFFGSLFYFMLAIQSLYSVCVCARCVCIWCTRFLIGLLILVAN